MRRRTMTDTIDATPLGSLARLEPIVTKHPVLRLMPKQVRANVQLDVDNVRRALNAPTATGHIEPRDARLILWWVSRLGGYEPNAKWHDDEEQALVARLSAIATSDEDTTA
jgi:hypothetical protein